MFTVVPVYGGNLGDALWLTPLVRYIPDMEVWMRGDDAKARSVAPIFQGLCPVRLEPNPPETPKAPIRAHVTQQILAAHGHGGKPSVPRILLMADEIQWAINYLAGLGYKPHSIAIVNHCSGASDPTNYRAHYVQGQRENMKRIAAFWRGAGYKVFQFGPDPGFYATDIFSPIEGNVCVRGLTVRQLAACYHVIGKMVSVDTGDYHLMLAVGGKVACLIPPHSDPYGYRHWDLCYDSVCWGEEQPRVRYALHQDWTQFMNTNLFNLL